jgi:hypothetical protein
MNEHLKLMKYIAKKEISGISKKGILGVSGICRFFLRIPDFFKE